MSDNEDNNVDQLTESIVSEQSARLVINPTTTPRTSIREYVSGNEPVGLDLVADLIKSFPKLFL